MAEGLALLIVEDDALQVRSLRRCLERAGHRVVAAVGDLAQALEWAATPELDGAVLDVDLGGPDSTPVADVLTERGLPFVVVTGYRSLDRGGTSLRAAPRLAKPVDPERLTAEVARFRQRREAAT